jgi:hypothetical protein
MNVASRYAVDIVLYIVRFAYSRNNLQTNIESTDAQNYHHCCLVNLLFVLTYEHIELKKYARSHCS